MTIIEAVCSRRANGENHGKFRNVTTIPDDSPHAQALLGGASREQAITYPASAADIVGTREFARGLEEVREGLPFNPNNDSWNYERGKLRSPKSC
jgi:hypothetical protein